MDEFRHDHDGQGERSSTLDRIGADDRRHVTPRKHPRDLVPRHILEHLAARAMRRGNDRSAALRLIDVTLVFLVACAENPTAELSPVSTESDEIWHDLITHTTFYPTFCRTIGRRFIHHVPTVNDDIASGRAHERTVTAMRRTGLPIDERLLVRAPTCLNTCNHACHDADSDGDDDK